MNFFQVTAYIILPLASLLIIPFIRHIFMKLTELDIKVQQRMTQQEVRQLIDDKFDPIKESLQEVKLKLDKIFDRLLNNRE